VTSGGERFDKAIVERSYSHTGAVLNYLVAGRKGSGPRGLFAHFTNCRFCLA